MKRKKRRLRTRRTTDTYGGSTDTYAKRIPISTVRLQREVNRLRELQDANAQSHTFPPPTAA